MSVPDGTQQHRKEGSQLGALRCAVLTVSDSRDESTDESGKLIVALLERSGHHVTARTLLKNDETQVRAQVRLWLTRGDLHAVLITGGTGLGSRDRTVEAVRPLIEKEIPGFGELFRLLSFHEQVGTSAMLSRALAGSAHGAVIVTLPGSRAAVELAMSRIVIPELPHLLRELRR